MDVRVFLEKVDELNRESRIEEVRLYMLDMLEISKSEGAWEASLTILNEMAGHYRDCGLYAEALAACRESEEILNLNGVLNTKECAAAYLNTANVYRAMGDSENSFAYYKKASSILEIIDDKALKSSYYNNIALLYQELSRFEDAIDSLKKALNIVEELGDEIRIAISKTNLAVCLIRAERLEEALENLKMALEIFVGRSPSDFHYSATLAAMGDLCIAKGDAGKAAEYYEAALSEIDLHMGQNEFFERVEAKLENAYKLQGGRPLINGLELCELYFKTFAFPILKNNYDEICSHIACGMLGEGSECLGFDDEISRDHDFGPAFLIILDDTVSDEMAASLQNMYNNLPKMFMGIKRVETMEGQGRVGVVRLKQLLLKATGFDHIPKGINEWQDTLDENLLLITNGRVFMDESGWFSLVRKHIRNDQPYFVYFNKLAMNVELMAKHGQYAFARAIRRGDVVTALIAKAEFLKAVMRVAHILVKSYAPYEKWLFKSFSVLLNNKSGFGKCYEKIAEKIRIISSRGVCDEDVTAIEEICSKISDVLIDCGLCKSEDTYLLAKAYELRELAQKTIVADKIVDIEWSLFDKTKNDGGRANCQDDWGTFSIMRRSQYYTWPMELLKLLYADYTQAVADGRNIITEKYGFMMESTAPLEFAVIKNKLPEVSDEKREVIDAIVRLQVGYMESFAAIYPNLADNARVIHSYEDTEFMTSYETYLRGELSTYHPDTLELYGRYVAELARANKSPAEMIINMTTFFYGYASLKDAYLFLK